MLDVKISGGDTQDRILLGEVFARTLENNDFKDIIVSHERMGDLRRTDSIFDAVCAINPKLFQTPITIEVVDEDVLTVYPHGSNPPHPEQSVIVDKLGTHRYKENAIVRYLLDSGHSDMNSLAVLPFNIDDRQQFAQLIGYSVDGYDILSYSPTSILQDKQEGLESTLNNLTPQHQGYSADEFEAS
jgi:hypothetical protein